MYTKIRQGKKRLRRIRGKSGGFGLIRAKERECFKEGVAGSVLGLFLVKMSW